MTTGNSRIHLFAGILLFFIWMTGSPHASGGDMDRLNGKIRKLHAMHTAVASRLTRAIQIRREFGAMSNRLTTEIQHRKSQLGVQSFSQAKRIPRIKYNVALIGELNALTEQLNEKITYLQGCLHNLEYHRRQTQDDVLLLNTVKDMEVDRQIEQLERALLESEFATTVDLIDMDNLSFDDPEHIWGQLFP